MHQLSLHKPDCWIIVFRDNAYICNVLKVAVNDSSKLKAGFELNQRSLQAHRFLYVEIPVHCILNKRTKSWNRRQQYQRYLFAPNKLHLSSQSLGLSCTFTILCWLLYFLFHCKYLTINLNK